MMAYALTWLPDVLRDAGLKVTLEPGWETRGHGDVRDIRGVMCHHTCGPHDGDIRDIPVLIEGRPDLKGPLCELGLGRSGTYHVVAAGKPWHAGAGNWRGITDGNAQMIGIEAENTGETTGPNADPWPEVQMEAYARGAAAILKHIGAPPIMCCGHKEYALPKGRKDDPSFDMDAFRARVAAIMRVPADKPGASGRSARRRARADDRGFWSKRRDDAGRRAGVCVQTLHDVALARRLGLHSRRHRRSA